MDAEVEKFLDVLLSKEALEEPSDEPDSHLELELPPWFDENKFKLGQKFYWDNLFGSMTSMLTGLLSVLAIPSILAVLVHTKRSSSPYTSYKRYLSTILHTVAWHKHPLKPGSVSWKSLHAVRSRHMRAGKSSRRAGLPPVSQRDLALTQFGFVGVIITRPDHMGLYSRDEGGWEGINHLWRTIGYMIGIKDKYNICRENFEETRKICEALRTRVFAPCLENVPEPFEHMASVLLDGVWPISPSIEPNSMLFFTRYLAGVPGYVYTEHERITFQSLLREKMKPGSTGVPSNELLPPCKIEGLPNRAPIIYKPEDYTFLDTVPEYKKLSAYARFKVTTVLYAHRFLYTTNIGRWLLNANMRLSFWLMDNFPFLAFSLYGYKQSFVNIFKEGPQDNTVPKSNAEVLKEKSESKSWLSSILFGWNL